MEDLDAAKLDDVKEWFQTYYGPANAVLVLAGDIDLDDARRRRSSSYFGDIPSGPPVARQEAWIAKRTGSQRGVMQDRVPQARLYKVWNVPELGIGRRRLPGPRRRNVLSTGKTSRLYKRLVYDDRSPPTSPPSSTPARSAASSSSRPTPARASTSAQGRAGDRRGAGAAARRRAHRRPSWSAPRPSTGPASSAASSGSAASAASPTCWPRARSSPGGPTPTRRSSQRIAGATAGRSSAPRPQRWLSRRRLHARGRGPSPTTRRAPTGADRSKLPEPGTPPDAKFPALERATLSNGLKIVLAERPSIPLVRFDLLLDAGFAADQFASPGTASLAMSMLDEGTAHAHALQISDELRRLGATLRHGLAARLLERRRSRRCSEHLDPSLALYRRRRSSTPPSPRPTSSG